MAKHLIYFRDLDGDHLVYIDVADELWEEAVPQIATVDFDATLRLGVANIMRPAQPDESRHRNR